MYNQGNFLSKQKWQDVLFLFKNSFTIIGKNFDILIPAGRMLVFSLINVSLIMVGFLDIWPGVSYPMVFFTIVILIPYSFFYFVRMRACQSIMVYQTICGKNMNFKESREYTKKLKPTLRKITLIDIFMTIASPSRRGKTDNIVTATMTSILSFFAEALEFLEYYAIPGVVIEAVPLHTLFPKLKELKKNVPAALSGVFGIDFVGDAFKSIITLLCLLLIILSGVIGYYLADFMPSGTVINFPAKVHNVKTVITFSWLPIYLGFFLSLIINRIINVFIISFRTIYFTIFYTAINHPLDINESIRDEITNYLLMKEDASSVVNSIRTGIKDWVAEKSTGLQVYKKGSEIDISLTFNKNILSGYSKEEVIQLLKDNGASDQLIEEGYRNSLSVVVKFIRENLATGKSEEDIVNFLLSKKYKESMIQESLKIAKEKET